MKKILFVLLIILSTNLHAQDLSFKEIKEWNSYEKIMKWIIENNQKDMRAKSNDCFKEMRGLLDGVNLFNCEISRDVVFVDTEDVEMDIDSHDGFKLYFTSRSSGIETYNKIKDEIINECTYIDQVSTPYRNLNIYSCPSSKYKGYIEVGKEKMDQYWVPFIKQVPCKGKAVLKHHLSGGVVDGYETGNNLLLGPCADAVLNFPETTNWTDEDVLKFKEFQKKKKI